MNLWGLTVKPTPAVSPYYQGYLDATRTGTYTSGNSIMHLPPRRFGLGSDAHNAWTDGVTDRIADRMQRPREHRGLPPHAII